MNKVVKLLPLIMIVGLGGCSSSNNTVDLKEWMKKEEKKIHNRIEPLPTAKVYKPVAFEGRYDPFILKPMIAIVDVAKNKYAPDTDRKKEPLEMYPLNSLKMTGLILKDNKSHAMIKTANGLINYLTIGNYMGQNYGKIVKLEENYLILEERIQNEEGDWELKQTVVELQESSPTVLSKKIDKK